MVNKLKRSLTYQTQYYTKSVNTGSIQEQYIEIGVT